MPLTTQPSPATRTALTYITIGALMVVWSGLWFWYLWHNPSDTSLVYYLCSGLMLTGITLAVIGLGLGQIGWAARHADLPPDGLIPTAPTKPAPPPATTAGPPAGVPPIIIAAPPGVVPGQTVPVQAVPAQTPAAAPAVPVGGSVAIGPTATSSDVSPPDRVDEDPKPMS
jgi:hypothetical protein